MRCQKCGNLAFLIQMQCASCNPEAHRAHVEAMDAYEQLKVRYTKHTGRHPVDDWKAFEQWCVQSGVPWLRF
jgi:ribosomal protein L37E